MPKPTRPSTSAALTPRPKTRSRPALPSAAQVDAAPVYTEATQTISLADLAAADELGYRVKLLGVAQRTLTGIEQRVHPTMVPKGSVIAEIDGVLNAVAIDSDMMSFSMV